MSSTSLPSAPQADPRPLLLDLPLSELRDQLVAQGIEGYRAGQIFTWVYRRGAQDFEAMTDLAKPLRARLESLFRIAPLLPRQEQTAGDRTATKCLFALADGREVEGVFLRLPQKETICFSTQVGCALGCAFCVTALMGRLRNLTPGEIVGQILYLSRKFVEREQGFNLVAMGMGEPLDNYDNLLAAIRIMKEVPGLNIGPRRVTVSTSGIVPMIERLSTEGIPLGLAISLNATTDETRSKLMPINRKYPIHRLLEAAGGFARATGRRVTIEYVLLRGVNDSPEDARRLVKLAGRLPSKINLIPFNASPFYEFQPPSEAEIDRFQKILMASNQTATIRRRRGGDIFAACGQLGVTQAR